MEKVIVFVDFREKLVYGHFVDDYVYKLIIKVDGEKRVIKRSLVAERLTYKGYEKMLKEALDGKTMAQLSKLGYSFETKEAFMNSNIRKYLLSTIGIKVDG